MKKIIHIDADCFYASVEMHENPELRNIPLAIGGAANKRGVIATCNYEARNFGVRSAMPTAQALKLCPFLEILPPRISKYREYSRAMRDIFEEYSNIIEPLSLDEAFLDVTESDNCYGSATLIAEEIRKRVLDEVGISVSAGVAPVKFLAKIASDWRKPNGIFVVHPDSVPNFVKQLPVRCLPGVGPVTAEKLARKGIATCDDVQKIGVNSLVQVLGVYGSTLFQMASGIDNREVQARSERKSVSVETTFAEDIVEREKIQRQIAPLFNDLDSRMEAANVREKVCKIFVKLKFNDFSQTTMEMPLANGGSDIDQQLYQRLINAAWQRKKMPLRLLGLGVRLKSGSPAQLRLDID